jgi:periplasmic protein TonB
MQRSGLLLAAVAALILPAMATPDESDRYYPERAAKAHVSGVARLDCQVASTGDLSGCKVVSESPTGFGFGQAALKMIADGKFKLHPRAELKRGGRTLFPVTFRPSDEKAQPPV